MGARSPAKTWHVPPKLLRPKLALWWFHQQTPNLRMEPPGLSHPPIALFFFFGAGQPNQPPLHVALKFVVLLVLPPTHHALKLPFFWRHFFFFSSALSLSLPVSFDFQFCSGLLRQAAGLDTDALLVLLLGGPPYPDRDVLDAALTAAVTTGGADCVGLLLAAGASASAVGPTGTAPLHIAAQRGELQVVTLLLEASADLAVVDRNGQVGGCTLVVTVLSAFAVTFYRVRGLCPVCRVP